MAVTVDAVVPSSDRIAGGVAAIILGSGFAGTPTVQFGGTNATSVVLVSATKLTCVVPAHAAGAVNVTVTNPDTTNGTKSNGFTYYAPLGRDTELAIAIGGSGQRIRTNAFQVSRDGPNGSRATFTAEETEPEPFASVRLGLGSLADNDLIFHGRVQGNALTYVGKRANTNWPVSAIDSTREFNRSLFWGTYVDVAADLIAADIIAGAPGFTGAHVVSGLDPVTATFIGATRSAAMNTLADAIGGFTYRDDSYDAHLYITETPDLTPDALDSSNTTLQNATPIQWKSDTSQTRNRIPGIGASTQTLVDAVAGASQISVLGGSLFESSGTVLIGSDRVTFSGHGPDYRPNLGNAVIQRNNSISGSLGEVAWSPTLGLFIAWTNNAGGAVYKSSDGVVWVQFGTIGSGGIPNVTFIRLIWVDALAKFIGVTGSATCYVSPDGVTWTSHAMIGTDTFYSVVWSPALSLLVAVGAKGSNHSVATSPDGTTWTSRTGAPDTTTWTGVVWSDTLNLFAAYGLGSAGSNLMTSPDGITWTSHTATSFGGGGSTSIAWSSALGLFVAMSGVDVATSTNGTAWTRHAGVTPSGNWRVFWIDDLQRFIAISGPTGTPTITALVSVDGLDWTTGQYSLALASQWWYGLAWSASNHRLVLVGGDVSTNTKAALLSSDAEPFSTLTGCSGLTVDTPAGASVSLYSVRNDLVSQAAIAAVEGGVSSGIYEPSSPIRDTSIVTQAALDARCDADLALYASAAGIITIEYTTRDRKSREGRPLHVDLSWVDRFGVTQSLMGDFVITSVSISNVDPDGRSTAPLYACQASSIRQTFSLAYLLRRVLAA